MKRLRIIFVLFLVCASVSHAFDQLTKTKEQIAAGKKKIVETKKKLKDAYQDQKSSMLDKIAVGAIKAAEQKKMVDQFYSLSKNVRVGLISGQVVPIPEVAAVATAGYAMFGDISDILQSLVNTVNSIQSTLTTLDSNVRPKIEYLNPTTDPKGIYKQADVAIAAFADVESKIDGMVTLLESLSAE